MPSPLIVPAGSPVRGRPGFSLVEVLVALAVAGLMAIAVFAISRSSNATASTILSRSATSALKQRLDARIGELVRIAPQYGDIQVATPTTLSFRKRQATGAAVCLYNGSVATIAVTAAEVAELRAGDSLMVRVGQATADTTDDGWAYGTLANTTTAAACGRATTLSVTLPTPPAANTIGTGATVRFWTTRRYTSTLVSADSGYAIVETVNGTNAARLYAFYASQNVFTYFDGAGSAAGSNSAIRLVRASVTPYAWRDGGRTALMTESMEWPVRVDDDATLTGQSTPAMGPGVAAARCTDPAAANFGDTRNVCYYVCAAPTHETQTVDCLATYGAGYSGTLFQERDKAAWPSCAWGSWVTTSGSCTYTPPTCSAPLSQWQTIACSTRNASWVGTIDQQRDKGAYPGCAWGGWYDIGNNCTVGTCAGPSQEFRSITCASRYGAGWGGIINQAADQAPYPSCAYSAWYDTSDNCVLETCGGAAYNLTTQACDAGYTGTRYLRQDQNPYPTCGYGAWYEYANDCTLVACPASQTQWVTCASQYGVGWTGNILLQNDPGPAPACVYGGWYTADDSGCQPPAAPVVETTCSSFESVWYPSGDPAEAVNTTFYERWVTTTDGVITSDSGWYVTGTFYETYDLWAGWAYYMDGRAGCS